MRAKSTIRSSRFTKDTDLQLALTLGRDDFGRRHGSGTNVMRCAADRAVDTIRERFGGAGVPPPGGSEVVVLTDETSRCAHGWFSGELAFRELLIADVSSSPVRVLCQQGTDIQPFVRRILETAVIEIVAVDVDARSQRGSVPLLHVFMVAQHAKTALRRLLRPVADPFLSGRSHREVECI